MVVKMRAESRLNLGEPFNNTHSSNTHYQQPTTMTNTQLQQTKNK